MQTEIGLPLAVLGVCKQNKEKLRKKLTQSRKGAKVNQGNWWGEAPEQPNVFARQTGDDQNFELAGPLKAPSRGHALYHGSDVAAPSH